MLFLSPESIIKESSTLTARLLKITAMKNLRLNEKIQVITPRTIRERVIAYLSSLAKKSGSHIVTTNFARQQLADFLCVDLSALSTELGKMHREGLIDLNGREFILPENSSHVTRFVNLYVNNKSFNHIHFSALFKEKLHILY